jgi:hypothetical protein
MAKLPAFGLEAAYDISRDYSLKTFHSSRGEIAAVGVLAYVHKILSISFTEFSKAVNC